MDSNNKLNVATRTNSGTFTNVITVPSALTNRTWYYTALKWQLVGTTLNVTVYVNDVKYTGTISDFKDFTYGTTAIGSSIVGKYQLNGQMKNFSYTGTALSDEEIVGLYQGGEQSTVDIQYDSIGRMTGKTINTGKANYQTSYEYKAGASGSSTTKIQKIDNNGSAIQYTYDQNGNMETITESGKTTKYSYNELNELIREDNQATDKTIVYTYDVGGNILIKEEYAYTTGTPSTPTKVYNYEYTDTNWKDKLTSFDGKAIEL